MVIQAPSEWMSWRWAYLDWFTQSGITSVSDYLQVFYGTNESSNTLRERAREAGTLTALEQMGIHGFERPTISNNQNIAIVGVNPHLGFDLSTGLPSGPPHDIDKYDSNFRFGLNPVDEYENDLLYAAGAGLDWLLPSDSANGRVDKYSLSIFDILAKEGWIDIKGEDLTSIAPRQNVNLINQIYYTNWFKYATPEQSDLKSGLDTVEDRINATDNAIESIIDRCLPDGYIDKSGLQDKIPNSILARELSDINPDLVISFGNLPKNRFFEREDAVIESIIDSPDPSKGITSVHGYPYHYTGREGVETTVIPLTFPGKRSWGSFSSEFSEPIQESKNRLTQALETIEN